MLSIQKKLIGNSVKSSFSALPDMICRFLLIAFAVFFVMNLAPAFAKESHTEALVRYYVETASEVFHKQDIRLADSAFGITVVVRRYSLAPNLDTLKLDTAIVRAFFTPDAVAPFDSVFSDSLFSDSLLPDSEIVLRSSYVDDKPELPALFTKPFWEGDFVYSLFPNDPGVGDISISYDSLATNGGLSQLGSSGILTIDRITGLLSYATLLIRSENSNTRYSRETYYKTIKGYTIPVRITERFSEIGFWENRYEIRETVFLNLKFIGKK